MPDLNLRVRYFQDSTPADIPCRESNFIRREIEMALPVKATAMILVDVWNVHFIESWIERAAAITQKALIPALEAAREAGLTIVHAPSPEVACKYPHHRPPYQPPQPANRNTGPDWPPPGFRRREGDYQAYRGPRNQPPGTAIHWNKLAPQLDLSPAIDVRDGEFVIATGDELHHLLASHRILHLIYTGFATNWCLLGRDYGIRAMARHAYNIIVLRDTTTGVEFPDTLENNLVTEISVREIEQQFGFSASNPDFLASCRQIE